MNCDTAFDLMTDPHGSRSGALGEHFATCTRCRQMQETLAPALEFLMEDEPSVDFASAAREVTRAQEENLQPFVSVESVKVAQQAAARLAGQADLPQVRQQRLALQALRYAAVFAAGLLLAVILVPDRHVAVPPPAGQCMRQAAAGESSGLSPESIQALARSCAVCHANDKAPEHKNKTSSLRFDRTASWDWLAPFFADDLNPLDDSRLVAGTSVETFAIAACRMS